MFLNPVIEYKSHTRICRRAFDERINALAEADPLKYHHEVPSTAPSSVSSKSSGFTAANRPPFLPQSTTYKRAFQKCLYLSMGGATETRTYYTLPERLIYSASSAVPGDPVTRSGKFSSSWR